MEEGVYYGSWQPAAAQLKGAVAFGVLGVPFVHARASPVRSAESPSPARATAGRGPSLDRFAQPDPRRAGGRHPVNQVRRFSSERPQ